LSAEPRVPPFDQQAGGERNDQRRDLRHQAVADRKLDEDIGGLADRHLVAEIADQYTADDVDRGDDQAGDRIATHEFRCTVHRTEEGAFLFQLAPSRLRRPFIDDAGRQVGVDRHLLAGNGVESEAGADLRDTGGALGDDDEVHDDQDQEDDQADHEIAAHHQIGKAADDVAGGVRALAAMRQDHARRGDVERQAQHGRDQQDGREGREIERPADPERHHQDQHRERDRDGQAHVDQEGRNRQKEDGQDDDDAQREEDVAAVSGGCRLRCNCLCNCHAASSTPLADTPRCVAG
jgi:hypothetical protein